MSMYGTRPHIRLGMHNQTKDVPERHERRLDCHIVWMPRMFTYVFLRGDFLPL
jgi:hypothetical protein